jgi:hypothetical protein
VTCPLLLQAVPGSWEVVGSSMEELEAVAAQLEATGKPADKRVAEHVSEPPISAHRCPTCTLLLRYAVLVLPLTSHGSMLPVQNTHVV